MNSRASFTRAGGMNKKRQLWCSWLKSFSELSAGLWKSEVSGKLKATSFLFFFFVPTGTQPLELTM